MIFSLAIDSLHFCPDFIPENCLDIEFYNFSEFNSEFEKLQKSCFHNFDSKSLAKVQKPTPISIHV